MNKRAETTPWLWSDAAPVRGGKMPPDALRMARDEEILVQPCVQEALRKARVAGLEEAAMFLGVAAGKLVQLGAEDETVETIVALAEGCIARAVPGFDDTILRTIRARAT